jgi:hypothetical protein
MTSTGYVSTEAHARALTEARRICVALGLDSWTGARTIVRAWGRRLQQTRRVARKRERIARRIRRRRQ